jgi:uncharacterized membrane protein
MRVLVEFIKTTLIGGFLIIVPVYVSLLLLAKVVLGLLAVVKPVATRLPAAMQYREIMAILVLAGACFIAGLVVRTGPGRRAKNAFEGALLEKLPAYALLRGLAGRLIGQADDASFAPALAEIEEALVPAFIVEKLSDGSYTVLVPSAPTPMAGALYILPPERVHPVDIPFTTALKVFTKWGAGAGDFVRAMQAAKAPPVAAG